LIQPFGSGPLAASLTEALRALLAPLVFLSASASLLLGLQRNYVGIIANMRSLNRRRREGDANAKGLFALVHASACLHARAITLLYAGCILLLLSACATGTVLFVEPETGRPLEGAALIAVSRAGLACFIGGVLLQLCAVSLLIREVALPLRSVQDDA
jgi:hypothetical protein